MRISGISIGAGDYAQVIKTGESFRVDNWQNMPTPIIYGRLAGSNDITGFRPRELRFIKETGQ